MRKLLSVLFSTFQGGVRGGLLLLLLVASVSAIYASDTQVDGIWYDFDSSTKTASVTYRGYDYDRYDGEYSGAVVIPETVTYNGTTYSVTNIGDYAFRICSSLTSVTIPNSVTSIGYGAFAYCSSLTSVTIGESVTSIGDDAFAYCTSLTSVTIPESVTSIGNQAFAYCSSLTSVTIGESVTSIGSSAFYGCSSLTSVTIPNSVTSIGGWAFDGCSSLTSVTIPNSVTSIGDYAFNNCTSLTSVTIPNSVKSIGFLAFYNCSSLTSVTIGESVTSIGDYAFEECSSLTSITCKAATPPTIGNTGTFDGVSKSIPVYVPCGCVEAYKAASGWKNFTNIQLVKYSIEVDVNDTRMGSAKVDWNRACDTQISASPNIGYHFVQWSDGNTENPRTLELTQDTAFFVEFAQTFSGQCGDNLYWSYQNNSLIISGFGEMYDERPWGLFTNEIQTVVLPNGITHIGNDAFSDCTGLSEITIPYTVTSIGDYAFAGCRKLVQVNCYAINPPMAESTSFANYNVYLNVPCDNLQDYQLDMVFGSFKYIQCMEADSENVPTDDVVVTPGTNDVTITWPTAENADTYTIVIQKGNEVFCTLTFNAEGQLLNMAFAPSRNSSNRPAQYAEQAVNGYRFTVTGLEEQTQYGYDVSAKDDEGNTISSYTGEFTTQSNTSTSVSNIQYSTSDTHKKLRNGHLIIIRDGVEYNVMGQEL
ncbi:MAG: leucine-rich repeat domain-containing protein [Paludibacteraceae bacterium]|nr:leucine-rich repeat domain-containing protein [Paludibacteraceae bacterium]